MDRKEDLGCCVSDSETPRTFEESIELGSQRRAKLIGVSSVASCLLFLAGILAAPTVGHRLLWAAALCGGPLLLGYMRQLMAEHRLAWQLVAATGLLIVGLLGYPIVPAAAAVAALVLRTIRVLRAIRAPRTLVR